MRLGAFKITLFSLGLCLYSITALGADNLQQRQQAAQADRQALQAQIKGLQTKINSEQAKRDDISVALRTAEEKISAISKTLHEYQQRQASLQQSLQSLNQSQTQQRQLLEQQRQALARQLKAQYASGLSSWTSILSGKDPQDINRDLSYLSYVLQSRVATVKSITATVNKLAGLSKEIVASQSELQQLQAETVAEQNKLKAEQSKRSQELDKVKLSLQDKNTQAKKLQADDKALSSLIQQLDKEIAIAAQKAKERKQALLKQQAKQAAVQAAKVKAEKAAQAKAAQEAAQRAQVKPLTIEPDGGFPGLNKGLQPPVKGKVLGRFGAQRPDGGVWRGIVLQTQEGTAVHAVADGKVVYASWLAGFGNLLIIDHGKNYLSIYGYNKSNLKDVGDLVASGEVIAEVGSTGGQVEPGLYFELRKDSAPINPQLWLGP